MRNLLIAGFIILSTFTNCKKKIPPGGKFDIAKRHSLHYRIPHAFLDFVIGYRNDGTNINADTTILENNQLEHFTSSAVLRRLGIAKKSKQGLVFTVTDTTRLLIAPFHIQNGAAITQSLIINDKYLPANTSTTFIATLPELNVNGIIYKDVDQYRTYGKNLNTQDSIDATLYFVNHQLLIKQTGFVNLPHFGAKNIACDLMEFKVY
jgi:hypothetical protein